MIDAGVLESHYGVCRHDIHSNIHSLSELRSLGKTLTELVFDAGCESYTKLKELDFSEYTHVTRIMIGNHSFKRVKEVIVEGLPLLVELVFGEGCFSYADEVSEEMPNGTLRVAACPALKHVTIGGWCCFKYSRFTLDDLPALETLTIGSRESRHYCGSFFHTHLKPCGEGLRVV